MASIQPRKNADGTVSFRVMYRTDGKMRSTAFRDHKAAREYARLVDRLGGDAAEKIRGVRADASADTPTLEEWFDHHLTHLTGVTPGTVAEYRRIANRTWLPLLGMLPIDAITADDVKRWVGIQTHTPTIRNRPIAAKTLRNAHNLLSSVIASSVPVWRPDNPARGTPLPRGVQEEMTFLSEEEFA